MKSKSFLQSKTIWSLLVFFVAYLIQRFHVFGGDPSQAGSIVDSVLNVLQVTGAIGAIGGRFLAIQPIHIIGPSDPSNPSNNGSPLPLVALVVLLLGLAAIPGCYYPSQPLTPIQQAYMDQANGIYRGRLAITYGNYAVDELRRNNKIDATTYDFIKSVFATQNKILDSASAHLGAGTPFTAEEKAAVQQAFIDDINKILAAKGLPPLPPAPPSLPPTLPAPATQAALPLSDGGPHIE